jgi:hypothetical protein
VRATADISKAWIEIPGACQAKPPIQQKTKIATMSQIILPGLKRYPERAYVHCP